MLRKLFCKHNFQYVMDYLSITYLVGRGDTKKEMIYIIYCPKCGKKKTVMENDYKYIMGKQRIDEEYAGLRKDRNSR